jgi:hypothetical protein
MALLLSFELRGLLVIAHRGGEGSAQEAEMGNDGQIDNWSKFF